MKPLASTTRSPRRLAAAGVVAATLTVGAAGAAYALAHDARREGAPAAAAPEQAEVPDASATWVLPSPIPRPATPLTQEQSDAFWAAGYYMEDADALATLWGTDLQEAKSRAGQLLLDGQPVPVAPGSSLDLSDPGTVMMLEQGAFWDAGYTAEDGATLAALWHVDVTEAKISAGKILRDGQALPIPPSGTPVS
ncbi:hypothetical protein Cch01nite_06220 [Cellulomonas chitinilytica]|uniref:Peptidoglycan-binding protein n=1 Tax=Cellulomonas chitinilytica TaxID=398759 RepID=A0A919TYN0_9CELL|nr:hypothetical protein [Cellulomonas chitinilytica]GIG19898.1 hypothetical protein Cch01nite_06220 [Cellulomonas chitinilytica]